MDQQSSDQKIGTYVVFNRRAVRELEPLLQEVKGLLADTEFSWEFTEELLTLIMAGEKIEFTHWKSATAYLVGFADGWHTGSAPSTV